MSEVRLLYRPLRYKILAFLASILYLLIRAGGSQLLGFRRGVEAVLPHPAEFSEMKAGWETGTDHVMVESPLPPTRKPAGAGFCMGGGSHHHKSASNL